MVMTIHKLTAGDGYTYLTRQVAGGDVQRERGQDAAGYYTAKGNPPGQWIGRGAPLLELDGQQVTEEQMRALFGEGRHPNAEGMTRAYLAGHLHAGMTETQVAEVTAQAVRAGSLGSLFPVYEPLKRFEARVNARLDIIEKNTGRVPTTAEIKKVRADESRRARAAVAGFDAVFAPVKSAAIVWALDLRPQVRAAVRQAHEAARDAALDLLEQHAAFTRTGKGGIAQIETRGLVAARFDHYDSRAGDPNLHTHVAISSKVCGIDGKWRSLDARALYAMAVAASEFYNTRFETELTARLPGVTFTERPDTAGAREPVREITGVPAAFIEHFSSRRTEIEARYQQLLRHYRREHGYDPSRAICHQLARQANLDTREGKKPARSLADMRADWTQSITDTFGADAVTRIAAAVRDPANANLPGATAAPHIDVRELAAATIANVAETRSTWTIWNVRAEAERLIRSAAGTVSKTEHQHLAEQVVAEALGPAFSILVDAPALLNEPAELRRGDGESVFAQHAAARYTSTHILDAEERLVAAAQTRTAVGLPAIAVVAVLDRFEAQARAELDPGQRQLVTAFAADSRILVAGLGAAGTGKTTAMRAYAHVTAQAGQKVIPLAPSAAAADVLGRELGLHAENLHKFLHEHTRGPHAAALASGGPVPPTTAMFAVGPGDVILVDEAGMAGTLALDQLVSIARNRGAVVRLLGDHRQLGAVESGGALRLIAHEAGAVELSALYRFTDPAEAAATLQLRTGNTAGLDYYQANNRIRSGSKQAMIETAYAGWKADMLAGKTTIMAAAASVNVTELAAQARRDRVEAGQVEPDGVRLDDGNLAGAGDWITTRRNARRMATARGRDWVKNGDAWTVTRRHHDGSLTVRHFSHRGTVRLPAEYVARHVELLYATSTHRAQGTTVDTAHPLITAEMSRENLYVIATRARERTTLHVVTHELLAYDPDERLDRVKNDARQYASREILENILAREGNELSATETIALSQRQAGSLATLIPRHQHAATVIDADRYSALAIRLLGERLAAALTGDEDWPAVVTALARGETAGWQPERLLTAAYTRDIRESRTPGRLLAWRIDTHVAEQPAPPRLDQPTRDDLARYASLLRPYLAPGSVPDPSAAMDKPAVLSHLRTTAPRAGHVPAGTLSGYAEAVAQATGNTAADVTSHRSWPHLAAALAAADRNGADPAELLNIAARNAQRSGNNTPSVRHDQLSRLSRTLRHLLAARGLNRATLPIPGQLRHVETAAAALGITIAERARRETAWPALHAALTRAEAAGCDPKALLAGTAATRELGTAQSVSEVLAWRLGRDAGLVRARGQDEATHPADDQWRVLAWTLKGIETRGCDAAQLVASIATTRKLAIGDLLQHIEQGALALADTATRTRLLPPWVSTPAAETGQPATPIGIYLAASADLIEKRITQLADTVVADSPAWLKALGPAPEAPELRNGWLRNIAIIAAYRDQHQITEDNPDQILGPFIEPGRPGQRAYWHAVDAVLAAYALTRPVAGRPGVPADPVRDRVAADIYLSLAETERATVTAQMAERLGQLWFGDPASLDDNAAVQHGYARQLREVLTERGHLRAVQVATVQPAEEGIHQTKLDTRPVEIRLAERRRQTRDNERGAHHEQGRQARSLRPRRQKTQHREQAPLLLPPENQTRQGRQYGL